MIRITPGMMSARYKSDVGDAYASMAKTMRHSYDFRSFDRPSDDPLSAAQTFDTHWQMDRNIDYSTNLRNLTGFTNTADKILQNVDALLSEADGTHTLKAISGTMAGPDRDKLGDQLLGIRDNIIAQMNSKYSDSYIFGGSNNTTAPFQMDGTSLYYRGINVDTGKMKDGSTPAVSLDDLDKEHAYVDIGLGLDLSASGAVKGPSAFDSAFPGISVLNYGGSDTSPKNVCSLLTKIGNELKASSSQEELTKPQLNTIMGDIDAFRSSHDCLRGGQVQLGQKMTFLEETTNYVSDMSLSLAEKDNNVEYADPTNAIQDYYQQLFCYNASLKVGSQLLQQSLIDYLR